MTFLLKTLPVGPWPVNSYLLTCQQTSTCAVVDPGAQPEVILEALAGARVSQILITHGHEDHVGAIEALRLATGAPVYLHPADAEQFQLTFDLPLQGGAEIRVGDSLLQVVHAPGHTPGMCCFDLGDGRILVGDAVFVGGPGKTWSVKDFTRQMRTMREVVFAWPDETLFYPGHGSAGRIGEERPAFEGFLQRGWPPDLFGDVTWSA